MAGFDNMSSLIFSPFPFIGLTHISVTKTHNYLCLITASPVQEIHKKS